MLTILLPSDVSKKPKGEASLAMPLTAQLVPIIPHCTQAAAAAPTHCPPCSASRQRTHQNARFNFLIKTFLLFFCAFKGLIQVSRKLTLELSCESELTFSLYNV